MRKYMQDEVTSPYKIMAVDDDEGILDSLKVVLKRSGYDLVCYSNPLEALEALKKEHYDLIVFSKSVSVNVSEHVRQTYDCDTIKFV